MLELVEVHPVEFVRPCRVEMLVGEQQVTVSGLLGLVLRVSRVSHLSEEKGLFNQNSLRNGIWAECRMILARP